MAQIIFTKEQRESIDTVNAKVAADELAELTAGRKIVVRWSQGRGGIGIFVKGRQVARLFDTDDAALGWLERVHNLTPTNYKIEIK